MNKKIGVYLVQASMMDTEEETVASLAEDGSAMKQTC